MLTFCDEIIRLSLGESDVLKDIEFESEDLISGETISSVTDLTAYLSDHLWALGAGVTDELTIESNASLGTRAQVKIGTVEAGRFIVEIVVTTSEGQVLKAYCRLEVEDVA